VRLRGQDAWVQSVTISRIGTHPVMLDGAEPCTLRDNLVERAYNKGGGGRGYYYLWQATHNLLFNETVRDIRHLNFSNGSDYNVFFNLRLEVDLNPHNRRLRHNLFEGIRSEIPEGHRWGKGDRRGFHPYDGVMSDGNLAYRVSTFGDDRVYEVSYIPGDDRGHIRFTPLEDQPSGGTLYAVTGRRD
jgi:hypothetical protein